MSQQENVTPTGILKEEHKAIRKVLAVLEKMCVLLEGGKPVPVKDLEQVVDFIRTFADRCHHGKEQDILFAAMVEAGFPSEGGPIAVMLMEHDMGRDFVRELAEGVTEYAGDGKAGIAKIVENGRNFISLLDAHIDKEDNILYPMADANLSTERQKAMIVEFEKAEREKIGPGKHAEYHRLIDRLQTTYR
ncbi:MAG: hemerythrin [Planctomycetes bacterium RBG_16_59_8]|nr:MAG: hemerythrin [Planctomycetes bacterium RBG_16_59_8]